MVSFDDSLRFASAFLTPQEIRVILDQRDAALAQHRQGRNEGIGQRDLGGPTQIGNLGFEVDERFRDEATAAARSKFSRAVAPEAVRDVATSVNAAVDRTASPVSRFVIPRERARRRSVNTTFRVERAAGSQRIPPSRIRLRRPGANIPETTGLVI